MSVRAIALIQRIDGIELPATGCWEVLAGQPLAPPKRRRLGTNRQAARTVGGRLVIAENGCVELGVLVDVGAPGGASLRMRYDGKLADADRQGWWRFAGQVTTTTGAVAADLLAQYHGVYHRGARPVAWIELRGLQSHGERCRGFARTDVCGDLLVARPEGGR